MAFRAGYHDRYGGSRGKDAGRTYAIPKLNTVTQSTANTEPDLLLDADVTEGLLSHPLRSSVLLPVSRESSTSPVKLENFKYLGSYNWLDSLVPGAFDRSQFSIDSPYNCAPHTM